MANKKRNRKQLGNNPTLFSLLKTGNQIKFNDNCEYKADLKLNKIYFITPLGFEDASFPLSKIGLKGIRSWHKVYINGLNN